LVNHLPTGKTLQLYINPEREIPAEATAIHGITNDFAKGAFTQQLEGALYLFPVPGKDKPVVKPPDTARRNPNQTKETADRLGINLSEQSARAARDRFGANDPRRTDSLDGGRAASAGAQRAAGVPAPTFGTTPSGAATGNPRIAAQGLYGGATQTQPAGAPRPPTSGGTVATETPLAAPQRLPASPTAVTPANAAAARQGASRQSPNSPTQPQNQPIVKVT
jgi:hypothetical protein